MRKIYLLSLIIALQAFKMFAQNTDWQFHTYHHASFNEDKAYTITQTNDGGYVFAGKYGSNGTGNGDILIGKLSSTGTLLWTKVYGDYLGDEARSIKELPDGSFILSGFTYQLGGTNSDTSYKNLLMKLDSDGDTLWTKRYGSRGIAFPEGLGHGVEATYDGGFAMVGKYANGSNGNDFYIVKTDANGDTLWTKLFGGTGSDIPRSIKQTADNGFIISGTTKSFGPNAGTGNMWLIKTNALGDTLWTSIIGTTDDEECFMARQTADGGYILAGRTGSNSASDLYAVKTDAAGHMQWSRTFGNPSENDFGRDIVQTADKGYTLIGARIATHGYSLIYPPLMYVVKMDSMGTKQWDKELGFDNTPNGANGFCIANTTDGGLIVSGFDQPDTASGGTEELRAFIVKFSPLATSLIPQVEENHECLVYPNPFSETATLVIPTVMSGKITMDIYNFAGQRIAGKHIEENTYLISISKKELSCGIYFYHLHSDKSGVNYRGKIIIE